MDFQAQGKENKKTNRCLQTTGNANPETEKKQLSRVIQIILAQLFMENLPNRDARLLILRAQMESDPDDPFSFYAFGLELDPSDSETLLHWEQVLKRFPDYLPSYYQAAVCLLGQENTRRALAILETGIALAQKQGNTHAEAELRSLYQNTLLDI